MEPELLYLGKPGDKLGNSVSPFKCKGQLAPNMSKQMRSFKRMKNRWLGDESSEKSDFIREEIL